MAPPKNVQLKGSEARELVDKYLDDFFARHPEIKSEGADNLKDFTKQAFGRVNYPSNISSEKLNDFLEKSTKALASGDVKTIKELGFEGVDNGAFVANKDVYKKLAKDLPKDMVEFGEKMKEKETLAKMNTKTNDKDILVSVEGLQKGFHSALEPLIAKAVKDSKNPEQTQKVLAKMENELFAAATMGLDGKKEISLDRFNDGIKLNLSKFKIGQKDFDLMGGFNDIANKKVREALKEVDVASIAKVTQENLVANGAIKASEEQIATAKKEFAEQQKKNEEEAKKAKQVSGGGFMEMLMSFLEKFMEKFDGLKGWFKTTVESAKISIDKIKEEKENNKSAEELGLKPETVKVLKMIHSKEMDDAHGSFNKMVDKMDTSKTTLEQFINSPEYKAIEEIQKKNGLNPQKLSQEDFEKGKNDKAFYKTAFHSAEKKILHSDPVFKKADRDYDETMANFDMLNATPEQLSGLAKKLFNSDLAKIEKSTGSGSFLSKDEKGIYNSLVDWQKNVKENPDSYIFKKITKPEQAPDQQRDPKDLTGTSPLKSTIDNSPKPEDAGKEAFQRIADMSNFSKIKNGLRVVKPGDEMASNTTTYSAGKATELATETTIPGKLT